MTANTTNRHDNSICPIFSPIYLRRKDASSRTMARPCRHSVASTAMKEGLLCVPENQNSALDSGAQATYHLLCKMLWSSGMVRG